MRAITIISRSASSPKSRASKVRLAAKGDVAVSLFEEEEAEEAEEGAAS